MVSTIDLLSRWAESASLHPSSLEPWSVDREKIILTIVPLASIQISMMDGNRNSSCDQFQNSTAIFTLCTRIFIPYQILRCMRFGLECRLSQQAGNSQPVWNTTQRTFRLIVSPTHNMTYLLGMSSSNTVAIQKLKDAISRQDYG